MSTFDVLARHGTAALLRQFGCLTVFLVLHLIRIPLVLIAAVLEGVMRRIDVAVTQRASAPPTRPVNQFFVPPQPNTYATPAYMTGERVP